MDEADRVAEQLTRDFLRPALRAAGFDGDVADTYEVTWVREDGFRPGLFAQEGDGNADCAGAHWNCQPWPKAEEE